MDLNDLQASHINNWTTGRIRTTLEENATHGLN